MDAVLNSGIFSRAPNLASFLKYVCDRHFEGDAAGIKEYCIAVEALKRPADFDQKKDSIVRVEAHRLRKRLADYYQRAGSDHAVRIEIPNGQYAPRFLYKDEWTAEPVAAPANNGAFEPEPLNETAVVAPAVPKKPSIARFFWIFPASSAF